MASSLGVLVRFEGGSRFHLDCQQKNRNHGIYYGNNRTDIQQEYDRLVSRRLATRTMGWQTRLHSSLFLEAFAIIRGVSKILDPNPDYGSVGCMGK